MVQGGEIDDNNDTIEKSDITTTGTPAAATATPTATTMVMPSPRPSTTGQPMSARVNEDNKHVIAALVKKINDMLTKRRFGKRVLAALHEELGEEYTKSGR